eukprot:CAMPEP_0114225020 /NCGR_PEP_ID=MMETSP0058-20121206/430_1 /TAXON_ID=36894 /ORGANISM="Pyramimonas parkeae, CCMP726" /LENGTH=38 /DNA_ID= /DNA_START= /DNA_END= /DNA_ORIENTATION=
MHENAMLKYQTLSSTPVKFTTPTKPRPATIQPPAMVKA